MKIYRKDDDLIVDLIIFTAMFCKNAFWFRLFGRGISAWRESWLGIPFSMRYGYKRYLRVFGWIFSWL
jgi:hypothetical protein